MRIRTKLLAVAAGLLLALTAIEPAQAAQPERLDALLAPIRAEFGMPGLVAAAVKGGAIVGAGAAGLRAIGFEEPATVEDRIHIGSNGKAMTALVAATLVEQGRLRWDSTIGEVLGGKVADLNPALASATLAQLLSHSSGIPTDTPEMLDIYFNMDAFDHNPDTLRLLALEAWKHNAPAVPEGSPFQYSNFGYLIAGAMLEQAAGKPWEMLVRERLFEPLGLESAGLGATLTPGRIDAMAGHMPHLDGGAEARLWGAGADMPMLLGPAGTLHMSILDKARWAGWVAGGGHRGPAVVTPETLAFLLAEKVRTPTRPNPPPGTPAEGGYAMGWGLGKLWDLDRELLVHNGSNGMNLAKILVDPREDLAIVVAVNTGGPAADQAASAALELLYNRYR